MTGTAMALPADHPMMVAWNAWCATDEFKSALHWASANKYGDGREIDGLGQEKLLKGALWLAFTRGMEAGGEK